MSAWASGECNDVYPEVAMEIPRHVAIILDGNGRWAKKRGMPRTYGHTEGAKNVEKIIRAAGDLGIEYLTFYAFSTENWSRSKTEVSALMTLFRQYLKTCRRDADKNQMRVKVLGDVKGLALDLQEQIKELEDYTAKFDRIKVQIAVNYGGRDEITRAMKKIAGEIARGELAANDITQETIEEHLDTAGAPDPDLLIRTSGELRLSNFLPWQVVYSEFYFTNVPWPDFDKAELKKAVVSYGERQRRFGNV